MTRREWGGLLLAAPALGQGSGGLTDSYREAAGRLIGAALTDGEGYRKLAYLCDRIGQRLSGSRGLEQAVAWSAELMRKDGLEKVVTPAVTVPHWVRGQESAELLGPLTKALPMLGLGGSEGTPAEGITAPVVVANSFEDLERLGAERVKGRIVVFNVPYQGYGRTVTYRVTGASRAAELGAVAMLLRAVGSATLQTPHTGTMRYTPGAPRIPAASITPEDAMLMARLTEAGDEVRVRLRMEARTLPDAASANVIGEIPGRERPNEVVVMGGHLDSWDVGQGAQDDGSGCIASLQAVALVRKLGLRPRRTLRVCFWTAEENSGAGGVGYRTWAGDAVKDHVAAIEMDGGAERPLGFGLTVRGNEPGQARALEMARQIGRLLEGIGAGEVAAGGGGADIAPLMAQGVPGLGLRTVGTHYFDWHHTQADTLDKVDPLDFRRCTATLAVMGYVLADMPERLAG